MDAMLYNQLRYYAYLFDTEKAGEKAPARKGQCHSLPFGVSILIHLSRP